MKSWDYLVGLIAVLMVSWSSFDALSTIFEDKRMPIVINRTEPLNVPVSGEFLTVRIWRDKVRMCPLTAAQYVSDLSGRIYNMPDIISEGGPIDTKFVDIEYKLGPLPEGFYTLHSTLLYICKDDTYFVQQPPTSFEVNNG